ncbi:MAG: hypothetical protein N3B21_19175 [Clostridia bacterium]|nr:hypothetical protein [Clostridia bacterium]
MSHANMKDLKPLCPNWQELNALNQHNTRCRAIGGICLSKQFCRMQYIYQPRDDKKVGDDNGKKDLRNDTFA